MKKMKIIPIRLIQENHDTDWDGVPNYRDCQPLNPLRQDDFSDYYWWMANVSVNAKPVKHPKIYDYLKKTIRNRTTFGPEINTFDQKALAETLSYLHHKEGYGVKASDNYIYLGKAKIIRNKSEFKGKPTLSQLKKQQSEFQKEQQYKMKRDSLALQMYGDHFVSLTPDQKRDVTREFNKMMR